MTFFRISALIAVAVAVGSVAACTTKSTGGSGGAGSVSTSIPAGKTASSMSEGERIQYCKDVTAYMKGAFSETEQRKAACLSAIELSSGSVEDLRAQCKEQYNACVAKPSAADAGASASDNCAPSEVSQFATCEATVAELNACFEAQVAQAKRLYAELDQTCDKIGTDAGKPDVTPPNACVSLEAKCPAIKESTDG